MLTPSEGTELKVLSFNKKDDKSTKYDIKRGGTTYRLKVDACEHGFKVMYLTKVKKIDHTPAPFKSLVNPDEMAYLTVGEQHVHEPKWYKKLFGWTLEKATYREITKMKKHFEESLDLIERAISFNESIELDENAGNC